MGWYRELEEQNARYFERRLNEMYPIGSKRLKEFANRLFGSLVKIVSDDAEAN